MSALYPCSLQARVDLVDEIMLCISPPISTGLCCSRWDAGIFNLIWLLNNIDIQTCAHMPDCVVSILRDFYMDAE